MKYIDNKLTKTEIKKLRKKYGDYIKITADLKKERIVAGCSLHADGEKVLLKKNGKQDDIWGGGLDFTTKKIDCSAVLNLRSAHGNPSMEILDSKRRKKFIQVVKNIFQPLWQN